MRANFRAALSPFCSLSAINDRPFSPFLSSSFRCFHSLSLFSAFPLFPTVFCSFTLFPALFHSALLLPISPRHCQSGFHAKWAVVPMNFRILIFYIRSNSIRRYWQQIGHVLCKNANFGKNLTEAYWLLTPRVVHQSSALCSISSDVNTKERHNCIFAHSSNVVWMWRFLFANLSLRSHMTC